MDLARVKVLLFLASTIYLCLFHDGNIIKKQKIILKWQNRKKLNI